MSTSPSPASPPAQGAPRNNRGLLIAVIAGLLVVCLCVVILAALGGGLYLTSKTALFGQASPTPVAQLIVTSTAQPTATSMSSPTAASSPTSVSSPTPANTPTLSPTVVPTTVATASPTVSSAADRPWANWPSVLSDSFASNTNGWNVKDRTSNRLTTKETLGTGKIHIEAQATQGTESERYPTGPSVADSYIEVTATQQSGPSTARYGLIFRLDPSSSDDYFFSVADDGTFRVSLYQGGWTNLLDPSKSSAIQPGKPNRLGVLAQGGHLVFYVNDQQVGAVDNSTLAKGVPGLAFELDANTQGVFDFENFRVLAPSAAEPTPTGQTSQATPLSPEAWPVILSEQFSSNTNGWNISDIQPDVSSFGTVTETIGSSKLRLQTDITNGINDKYYPKSLKALSDMTVTVDAQRLSGDTNVEYGLMFRRNSSSSCYVFLVRDAGDYSVLMRQDSWTTLVDWTHSDAIEPGKVNHLAVTAQGPHFTFSINNLAVKSLDNSAISTGTAGVVFEMDPGQAVFEFSNFTVRAP